MSNTVSEEGGEEREAHDTYAVGVWLLCRRGND